MKKLIFAAVIGSLLSLQAESLNARLSYRQGVRYREGKMCPRDLAKSVDCFYTAATQDCVRAMEMLAICYHNGQGVAQDYRIAAEWHQEAAQRGAAYSQFMMGVYRHSGLDGICNPSEAIRWFRLAAEHGFGDPNFTSGQNESEGCGQDVSLLWLDNAAQGENPNALYWLANSVRNGWGTPRDLNTALELYRLAAERGCSMAEFVLGRYMWRGIGGSHTEGEAKMRDAAAEGNVTAALAVEVLDNTGRLPN